MSVISISPISVAEFEKFQQLIYQHAGISLAPEKKVMVASRLAKRLNHYGLPNYGQYYQLATNPDYPNEFQMLVNILTTNETYFFREPKHFDFFRDEILKPHRGERFRVWSAASSTGEEAHSLAMVMADTLGMRKWEIFGSDLSTRVLDIAKNGVYPMERLEHMPATFLEKYALKGVRSQEGYFRVIEKLRDRMHFDQANLMKPLVPSIGKFDVIFLDPFIHTSNASLLSIQIFRKLYDLLKYDGVLVCSASSKSTKIALSKSTFKFYDFAVPNSDIKGLWAIKGKNDLIGSFYDDPYLVYRDKQILVNYEKNK